MSVDPWVGVPLRWRHVMAGDVFTGKDGLRWTVKKNGLKWEWTGWDLLVERQGMTLRAGRSVDPDDVTSVLVPATERDAVELVIDRLGARLVSRREATFDEQALPAPPSLEQE
jgi:hypothetical protein